jgi:uncharacterized membrane protein YfcA
MDAQNHWLLAAIAMLSFVLSFYGAAVGLIMGHLRLPLLIYYLPSTAAGMAVNLAVSGVGALTGALRHARDKRVSVQLLLLMGIPSVIGASLGATLLLRIDSTLARVAIGVFLIGNGLKLMSSKSGTGHPLNPFRAVQVLMEVVIGLLIGFLAAVTGLMLGSVRLPMMIRYLKIDAGVAVGTNMAIGCLTAFAGAGSLWPRGADVPWLPLLVVIPPTVLGGYLGAHFTGRFRKEVLQRLVGWTVALTGFGMAGEGVWNTFLAAPRAVAAEPSHESALVDFNRDIRPILSDRCFACHGPDQNKRKAGLRLDTHAGASKELRSGGFAIVPGNRTESKILGRLTAADGEGRMPPGSTGKRVSPAEIDLLGRWIDQGANWDTHWAYTPPRRPALPELTNKVWPRNAIDNFVLHRLEQKGLTPSPEADRATLLRRLSFDLTGLPPTRAEVDAFLRDDSPNAYEKVVDRLLASSHYGERMALPWLDLARYADTNGYRLDNHRDMWLYRDWVIAAFNQNKPFDEFTIEQLAGDMLPGATTAQKIASGFHRNTMVNFGNGSDPKEYLAKAVMDRVNTTATVWLGTTLACAQCHDHKYDPFTQKDYYRLYAFFNNVPEKGLDGEKGNPVPTLSAPSGEQERQLTALRQEMARLEAGTTKKAAPAELERLKKAESELLAGIPSTLVMAEMSQPRVTHVLRRGDYLNEGAVVNSGVPESLPPLSTRMPVNRLGLAHWLTDPAHPLTSRVIMNRVWQMFFGNGIVRTVDDFGSQGEAPSHPELLDWLATELVARGWDLKAMHKLIVLSATYRQSSHLSPLVRAIDPDNRLLARGPRSRLEAEMIRDNALAVSGLLHRRIGGPSVRPYQPAGLWEQVAVGGAYSSQTYVQSHGADLYRRGIYMYWKRSLPPPSLVAFDAPTRELCTALRPRTNTALQALVLMNDPTYIEAALALAVRVMGEGGQCLEGRRDLAFKLCTGRSPRPAESRILTRLFQQQLENFTRDRNAAEALTSVGESTRLEVLDSAKLAAWTAIANVLLNLDETITKG